MPRAEDERAELVDTSKNQLVALENSMKRLASDAKQLKDQAHTWVQLKTTIGMLDGLYEQASNVLLRLEGLDGPQQRREPLMAVYLNAKVLLEEMAQKVMPAPSSSSSNALLDQTIQQSSGRSDHLPRIELPRFNGSPTEWLSFKSRFEKRISALNEDADKFAFLAKCLEKFEPAKNSVEALENSGTSFAEAWQKLETRFYKRRIAFEGYFTKLLMVKKIMSPNAKGIMALIDAVDTAVHAAHQIQGERNQTLDSVANGLIIAIVKGKLDDVTLSKLEESLDLQKIYTWAEFKAELEKRANQLACQYLEEAPPRGRQHKTAAVAAATPTKEPIKKAQSQNNQKNCFICGSKEHSIFYCAAFNKLPLKERWEAVSKSRRCYNCMSWGHSVQKCSSNVSCKECGARHHTLLHFEAAENPPQPTQKGNEGSTTTASASTSITQ